MIGRRGDRAGATLIAIGGIHGNEPAGVEALRQLLSDIDDGGVRIRGELLALVGNRNALARGQRFVERDLNRMWDAERCARLLSEARFDAESSEGREQRELLRELAPSLAGGGRRVVVVDLHTASGDSVPFALAEDSRRARQFANRLPIPRVLGLVERLDGRPLIDHVARQGHVGIAVEGGRHDDPLAVQRLSATLWCALAAAGLVPDDRAEVQTARTLLREECATVPACVEVTHRHPVRSGDGFAMARVFENFAPVQRGALLARERSGDVRAPEDGLILLPLYQGRGDDGYFLARPLPPSLRRLARVARALPVHLLLPLVPGLRGAPRELGVGGDAILIEPGCDARIAGEFLDFLGYRRRGEGAGRRWASRRGSPPPLPR